MEKYYDESVIDRIKERLPLSEYAANYIKLTKKKDKLFGLCPFHYEDTPSFMIDPTEQRFYCFGCHAHGDILAFIMMMENVSFARAVEIASDLVGEDLSDILHSETLSILKKYAKPNLKGYSGHAVLDKAIYDSYKEYVDKSWVKEGVPRDLFHRYEIRLDKRNNRIIYPVYDVRGNFINIKGRTRDPDFKEKGIPKYINYYKVGTMDYLQGLHLNKDAILGKREVIIFEGVKSCMKAEGFGFNNVVSAETSSLTEEQIKLLISLHVNVVIAFDKDKKLSDYYNRNMSYLRRFAGVYYINDTHNLLGAVSEKNSPVDKGEEVWVELYKNRREVNRNRNV